ncbi:class F sortase [Catelliglobosispora koreensis]|uniref:class F sortase n=1 Tax=Catelliglobosispora koreensis TaxID=129052 RepID=UPI00035FDF03|nr:class F sortase [Catelliglobosispora koreensis]
MSRPRRRLRPIHYRRIRSLTLLCSIILAGWGIRQFSSTPEDINLPVPVISATAPPSLTGAVNAPRLFLPRSVPTRINIPKIRLSAVVLTTDIDASGQLKVPSFEEAHRAAWYRGGVAPGEIGPAVLIGHADSKKAVGVFFYTRNLRPGDQIGIEREDKRVATFTIDSVEQVPKTQFPATRVYGMTDRSEIRLVTCAGTFDERTQNYSDNIIIFGHLTALT